MKDYVTSASLVARDEGTGSPQGGAVYIVMGTTGEYSDRKEWPVAAYLSEEDAQAHILRATQWLEQNYNEYDRDFDRWAWIETKPNPHDPDMDIDYTGASWFSYGPIPLHRVSDGRPKGQDAQRLDRNDDSTAASAETQKPSPINKGAETAKEAQYYAESIRHYVGYSEPITENFMLLCAEKLEASASLLLSLSSNLEETQKERDAHKGNADDLYAKWIEQQSRLTLLQNRLQEVEGEAAEIAREAAEEIEAWGAYADAYFQEKHDLKGTVQKFRARALLPKGESR